MSVVFRGSPREIGSLYGQVHRSGILANLDNLLGPGGVIAQKGIPTASSHFNEWVWEQEARIASLWPWLLDEMRAVADACGASHRDLLLLNLRSWQYDSYGAQAADGCSSFAMRLADGHLVCAGALDDPPQFYCGPVAYAPDAGYSLLTFPLTGTSWGNRGINSAGLALGISSQRLPGLRQLGGTVNQDLALRVILQTCATVDDVRSFCHRHPFTMNLVAVDAGGGLLCAHQTCAGYFEQPVQDGWCALTNHVSCDEIVGQLASAGAKTFPEGTNSRARRGRLLRFCRERSGKASLTEVKEFLSSRRDDDPGSIHNYETCALTVAVPQTAPTTLWVMQPGSPGDAVTFETLTCPASAEPALSS